MKILIAGSMKASDTMKDYAFSCVERAWLRGYTIIVGDNPRGIDRKVINACHHFGMTPSIYGIHSTPRYSVEDSRFEYVQIPVYDHLPDRDKWRIRDEYMAQNANIGIFIWNYTSKGTQHGFEYMKHTLKKDAYLKPFTG